MWVLGLFLTGCALLQPGPDAAVRAYFEAVQQGRDEVVRSHVATACQSRPLAKGAPGKLLFVPVQMSRLDVAVVSSDAVSALVAYEYEGVAGGEGVDETVNVLGSEVKITMDRVDAGAVTRSGQFEMIREGGEWKISC